MKYMRHLAFSCLFIGMLIFGIVYAQASGKQRSVATHTVVTPTQQDAVPKYYKAFVQYIAQPGSIIVDNTLLFKGSIDYTDYEKWQLYYYNDYIWSTSCSCYTLDQTFGPSSFAFILFSLRVGQPIAKQHIKC